MKKITAFKLSNGEIVTDENEAILREKELSFENDIKSFADNNVAYTAEQDSFIETVIENKDELMKIFMKTKTN